MATADETLQFIAEHLSPFFVWNESQVLEYATAIHNHTTRIPSVRFAEICRRLASEMDPNARMPRKPPPAAYWSVNKILDEKNTSEKKTCESCGGAGGRMWCAWNPRRWPREGEPVPDYRDVLIQDTEPCACDQSVQARNWRTSSAKATNDHSWEVIGFEDWGKKLREYHALKVAMPQKEEV